MPILANARHEGYAQDLAKGMSQLDAWTKNGTGDRFYASRLANRADIRARVAELQERAAERAEITQADVLRELAKIGFSDIRKLFNPDTGALKRVEDLDDDAAACLSSIEVVTKKVPGGDEGEVEHTAKIKLWDKPGALVNIGKHLGMFKERIEHSGPDGAPIEVSDKDAVRRMLFLIERAKREGAAPA